MKNIFVIILFIINTTIVYSGEIDGAFGFRFGEYLDRSKNKFSSFEEYLPGIFRSTAYKPYKNKEGISEEYQLIVTHRDSIASIMRYEVLSESVSMNDAEREIDLCTAGAMGDVHFYEEFYNLTASREEEGEGYIKYVAFEMTDGRNSIRIMCHYMQGRIMLVTEVQDPILMKMTNSRSKIL